MDSFLSRGENEDFHYFDPNHADALLARDLNRMTVEQRSIVFDDVHGVRNLRPEETNPIKMMESLDGMNSAIHRIEVKPAFDEAYRLDSQYVLRDKQFRMKFLRAEEYDFHQAAQRFVNYLDFTYELFGPLALMRPLFLDDLSKEEQNVVKDGSQQLLPIRDRMGRRIFSRIGNMGKPGESQASAKNMKVNIYMLQEISSDETTQKFGMVWVLFSAFEEGETNFLKEPNVQEKIRKCLAALPLRITGIHLCLPNTPKYQFAAAAISLIAPSFMRVRVRKHLGSVTECKYSLMAYGIPGDQLPITASGRIKTNSHIRWIKTQKERERSIKMGLAFDGIDCPLVMDILIGNVGQCFRNSPGNTVYYDVIALYFKKYEEASDTQERTRITWKVLEDLSNAGGRVLVRDRRGWWVVATMDKAREKIANDFREMRKRILSARKRSEMDTSTTSFLVGEKRFRKHDGGSGSSGGEVSSDDQEGGCFRHSRMCD